MQEPPDNDDLWKLLGRARPVRVSPYFSRRVLREIRQTPARPPIMPAFLLRWLGAGALALLMAGFFISMEPSPGGFVAGTSPELIEAFDIAAGLDLLATVEEISPDTYVTGL